MILIRVELAAPARTRTIPLAKSLIGEEERIAADRVRREGTRAQGPEVSAFEVEFAAHITSGRACVAVSSGASGLYLGMLAAGVGPGDEVIVPSFTSGATANAVALTGATPVFVDIDPRTFCLSPAAVAAAVTARTVGVLPVHLYGHPAEMDTLDGLAYRYDLQIYEDAVQADGACLRGRRVGTFGSFAVFSVYPAKDMTAAEGGMVVIADAGEESRLRLYRNRGGPGDRENEVVGSDYRLCDLHAAIGRVQLAKVSSWIVRRRANAAFLSSHLTGVARPTEAPGATHVYHRYTVRVPEDRDGFARALWNEHGVESGSYPRAPVHRLRSPGVLTDLPATEDAARECLSLPVHHALSLNDLDHIVTAVTAVAAAGG